MVRDDAGPTEGPTNGFVNRMVRPPWLPPVEYFSYVESRVPKPVPILGPWVGYPALFVRAFNDTMIYKAERFVRRPLTTDEQQALATHGGRLLQTNSYFASTGALYGAWRWYRTMSTFNLPLYRPKNINPYKFLIFKDSPAYWVRHGVRFSIWWAVGVAAGHVVGSIFAVRSSSNRAAADPALKQFSVDLRVAAAEKQKQRPRPQQDSKPHPGEQPPHAGQPRWGSSAQRPAPQAPPQRADDDDMSPTSGNDDWFSAAIDAEQTRAQPNQASSPQPKSNARQENQQPDNAGPDGISSTGGSFQDEMQDHQASGESAWDRIRRGNGQSADQKPMQPSFQEQKEGSALGDGFPFAESDEERKQAQAQAQREFDARLELERQGKDFNDDKRR